MDQVLFDDGYWPTCGQNSFPVQLTKGLISNAIFSDNVDARLTDSSEPARSLRPTWDEMAEAFIRERDVSRIIFKLNKAEKETLEDVFASYSSDLDAFLELALVGPIVYCWGALIRSYWNLRRTSKSTLFSRTSMVATAAPSSCRPSTSLSPSNSNRVNLSTTWASCVLN
jgi:hypothetical protein